MDKHSLLLAIVYALSNRLVDQIASAYIIGTQVILDYLVFYAVK